MAALMGRDSATSLAPGFRFHPTDEELVRFFLKRKVSGKAFRFDPIGVVDIYKSEPWDLPCQSKLKSRDLQWYFFSGLDKKYGKSSRANRATEKGHWKTTGKDRPVRQGSRIVGMRKTLVYHSGRAPHGTRTNWVMHEFRMADEELANAGIQQDAFVLCRVFQKSGAGPKNGEQYGAPFLDEEWENDEVAPPGEEAVVIGDGAYVEINDLEQNLDMVVASESVAAPINFVFGESSSYPEHSQEFENQMPMLATDGTFEPQDDQSLNVPEHSQEFIEYQEPMVNSTVGASEPQYDQFLNMPELNVMDSGTVEDEYTEASHDENPLNFNYALDDQYLDATDVPPFVNGSFLETNDLVNPIGVDPSGVDIVDEYLSLFDADDDITQYISFDMGTEDLVNPIGVDPSGVDIVDEYLSLFDADDDITQYISFDMGTEDPVPDQSPSSAQQNANEGSKDASMENKHVPDANCSNKASSSKQNTEDSKLVSGNAYSFIKQASHWLDSIPAPPAFAAEFPSKEVAFGLHSAAQSSNSAHVTAGMFRISDISLRGNGMDWTLGKNGEISFLVSSGLCQSDIDSAAMRPVSTLLSGKSAFMLSHGWVFLVFFSVLILSLSCKIGSFMYTGK